MNEGVCWADGEGLRTCPRDNMTAVWRDGQTALACETCRTIVGLWIEVKPAQPDTMGQWRDCAELVK